MPSNWIYTVGKGDATLFDRNVSRFAALAGRIGDQATEDNQQVLARAAYTWQNIGARVTQNNLDGTTSIFARIGGVDQAALEVQIGANSTGWFEDTAGSVSVADGDLINYRIAAGSGAHLDTIDLRIISSQLQHASLERPIAITSAAIPGVVDAGSFAFYPIIGALGDDQGTESEAEYTLRQGVTFTNMRCFVFANNTDIVSTFGFRVDGASPSNLNIGIGANATGAFEDTDSEVVSAGSTVNYQVVAGIGKAGDSIDFTIMHLVQAGAVTGRNLGAGNSIPGSYGVNTTNFIVLEGPVDVSSTTELDTQIEAPVAVAVTDMFVRVTANSLTSASTTISLRANGATTALSLALVAGATGIFEDSDTVSLALDDLINWRIIVGPGGSGTVTISIVALEQGQPVAVEGPEVIHFRSLTAFGRP